MRLRRRIPHSRQGGLSLVELLIGLVLGGMLIAGAGSIYLASKRSYVEVEQVAALSENARFAQQTVQESLRHAGFFGEVSANMVERSATLDPVTNDCSGLASSQDLSQFVFAASATTKDVLACIDDAYLPPSGIVNDVLVIKRALPRPLTDSPREPVYDPSLDDGVIDGLDPERTYIMTNNVSGMMFDGGDTPPDTTAGGAMPNSSAWEYQYEVFYIRDGDIPQLSRMVLTWGAGGMELQSEDLAEGVENLRLLFGLDEDRDGEVDRYTNVAGVAGNWALVDSVEVYMLTRSPLPDPQYTDQKTYQLGDTAVAPGDNFRRLPVFTSVSMRNLKLMLRGGA